MAVLCVINTFHGSMQLCDITRRVDRHAHTSRLPGTHCVQMIDMSDNQLQQLFMLLQIVHTIKFLSRLPKISSDSIERLEELCLF